MTEIDRWIDALQSGTTLADLFLENFDNPDSPVFYWYRVLWDSFHQACALVWDQGWTSAVTAVVIFVASILIHDWFWGRHAADRELKPAVVVPGAVGVSIAGVIVIFLMVLGNAFSLYDEQRMRAETADLTAEDAVGPDTAEQAEARLALSAFHDEYLLEASIKLEAYAHAVHAGIAGGSAPPRQLDQDRSLVLGGLLAEYRGTEIDRARSSLADGVDGREKVPFDELMRRFESYYRAYTDLAEWTQRVALAVNVDMTRDTAYQEWNEVDETFLSRLRAVTAQPSLARLRGQISEYGVEKDPWDVFRIRQIEADYVVSLLD